MKLGQKPQSLITLMKRAHDDLELGNPIKFYDGEIILRFCTKKNGRPAHGYYRIESDSTPVKVDGVTGICGILDKSSYLMPWAAKVMAEQIFQRMPRVEDELGEYYTKSLSWNQFIDLINSTKAAHRKHLIDATDVGTAAHSWIEDSIRWAIAYNKGIVEVLTEKTPSDIRAINCGHAAFDWMKSHNVRWLKTEHIVYSRIYSYAGTMDGLALVDSCSGPCCRARKFENELSVIDWKSSNSLRIEYLYQTAAYQNSEQEEFGNDIKARWILRLGKEDGEFEPWYELDFENDFETFKMLLFLKRQCAKIEKRMSENKKLRGFLKRKT